MHGLQQRERVDRVVPKILFRNLHGLASFNKSRKMHHGVNVMFLKEAIERGTVRGVRNDELCSGRDRILAAVRQIIADDDLVALGQKLCTNNAADIPGTASNKNALGHLGRSSFV